ncbi:MAG: hypothetical protein LBV04_06790 [Deferribacteraceae bacterium]|jgi:hypothetical protein|nr:hypothetical protein [Deferribacteraceae bacterium]
MKKAAIIFLTIIIFVSMTKESFADAGAGLVFYFLSPMVVPIGIGTSDEEKVYSIGIEPIFSYTDLSYELGNDEKAKWELMFPAVSLNAGIAAPVGDAIGMRIEAELAYGAFNGDELFKGDSGDYRVSNYKQFAAMLNFYYDIDLSAISLSTKLGLGMVRHIFDVNSVNTIEYKRFSKSLVAIAMGMELRYHINEHHSIELDLTELMAFGGTDSSFRFALGYKYQF